MHPETKAEPKANLAVGTENGSEGRFARLLLPNRAVDATTMAIVSVAWACAAVAVWLASPWKSLPSPLEVWHALGEMWWHFGLGPELFSTLSLIGVALGLTLVVSLGLSYLTVVALFRPLVMAVSKLRFLSLTGLVFPFTLITGGGQALKILLLTFGMTTFFVTSMAQAVVEIPREQFDSMRVLGASQLRTLWEVVILGTLDKALDITRQNLAMGWAMITMVEGISRAEGGVGALILNQYKHLHLAEVYAILAAILIVGLLLDYLMGLLIRFLCPHVLLDRLAR